jgi:hypothetical protein
MIEKPTSTPAHRLGVLSRTLAAAAGGYVLMIAFDAALTFLLPIPRRTAFLYAVQAGFLVYTLAIIWAFAARTATRAWLGLLLVMVPLLLTVGLFHLNRAAP